MSAQCTHKWWFILKSAVFGSNSDSSLPPFIEMGRGVVVWSVSRYGRQKCCQLILKSPGTL